MSIIEAAFFEADVRTAAEEITFADHPLYYARLPILYRGIDPGFREYFSLPRQDISSEQLNQCPEHIAAALHWHDFQMAEAIYNQFFFPVYGRMMAAQEAPLVEISFQDPRDPFFMKAVIDSQNEHMEISTPLPLGDAALFYLIYQYGRLSQIGTGEELAEQPFDFEHFTEPESRLMQYEQARMNWEVSRKLGRQSVAHVQGFVKGPPSVVFFKSGEDYPNRPAHGKIFTNHEPYSPFPGERYVFDHEKVLNIGSFSVRRASGDTKNVFYPLQIDTNHINSAINAGSFDWLKFPWGQISYDYKSHIRD